MTIKKQLLLSNIMIYIVPILLISIVGKFYATSIYSFRANGILTKTEKQSDRPLTLTQFQEGSAIIEQALRKSDHTLAQNLCRFLENNGAYVSIVADGDKLIHLSDDFDASYEKFTAQALIASAETDEFLTYAGAYGAIYVNTVHSEANSPEFKIKILTFDTLSTKTASPFTNRTFSGYFMIIWFAIIIIIFSITNGTISMIMSRNILNPLKILQTGTNYIKQGYLDHELTYTKKNEFGELCRDFEDMRLRLGASVKESEKYEESRKELIMGISHDLNTPITLIKGYAAGIMEGIADTPEKQVAYMNTIINTADNMKQIVNQLFLFSKLDLKKVPFYFETLNLVHFFNDCCSELQDTLDKKDMDLEFHTTGPTINGKIDILHFKRVVQNIIDNSVKYKKKGRGKIEIFLSESLECNENKIMIEFRDYGKGILTEDREKIFEIFYRTDKARANTSQGSGIGLATVKQIVNGHRGSVRAQNHNDGGLSIFILLPKEG